MDVKDALKEKRKVEQQITELICDLEERTGLSVTQIALCYITRTIGVGDKRLGLQTQIFMEL
jgi:hypothetical protein